MDNRRQSALSQGMEYDVAIVGGGLSGNLMALALARAGVSVAVVDPTPRQTMTDPAFDGRSYAMALTSCRVLEALGLWPDLAPQAQEILRVRVSDAAARDAVLAFDHHEIQTPTLGHMIEDRHLRRVVLEHVDQTDGITVLQQQTTGLTVDTTGVDVQTTGAALRAALVVGADGRGGRVAEWAGIRRLEKDYGQTSLVCAIRHSLPHEGTAQQIFFPSGPLAVLPLRDNCSGLVWTEARAIANALQDLPDEQYLAVLNDRLQGVLGQLELVGGRYAYPLTLKLAHTAVADRVALIGDAAHGLHPIAGQGLNAGIRDIAALEATISSARRCGLDIGQSTVLAEYQRWRAFDNSSLAMATDGFNGLFSNENPLLRAGRRLGMRWVGALPGLRRAFAREAMGLTGTLPPLMQGA